jgi:hypothetical protein
MTPTSLDSPREPVIGSSRPARVWLSKRGAKIAAWAFATVFAIFRLVTFIPQPLDGPHTLRPILNAGFDAFLRHYEHPEPAYEDWRAFCLLALMMAPALAVLNLVCEHGRVRLPDRAAKILCSRWLLFGAIAATLLLCRYPTLVDYQLNPDEGQFLAAAHKLFYEPNFFDSVDCGTSGPLNIYPLMLPAIFGVSPDYASSRILVLLITFCTIYLFYRTVRLLAPDSVARIAILPLASGLAVLETPSLVHYSSEQIPLLLVALALYLAVRVLRDPAAHRVPLFLLGFLASSAFFAKMQSVPIVGAIGAAAVLFTYASGTARRSWQPALLFVTGMLPLQLLNAAMCLAAGAWTNFWMTYIVSNQRYADRGSNFVTELPGLLNYFFETPENAYFLFTFLALCAGYGVQRLRSDRAGEPNRLLQIAIVSAVAIGALMATVLHADAPSVSAFLALIAVFMVLVFLPLLFERGSFGADPVRWFGLISLVAIAATVFSLYRPHRLSSGYLLFLFPPVAAAMAWMLIRQTRESPESNAAADSPLSARLVFPLLFAALALTQAIFLWGTRDPHKFRTTVATIRQSEGDFIRSLTSPKGKIFVWGWTVDPFLGSGRVPSTRDLNLNYQFIAPVEITSYYRARLLNDLTRDPPELFIDAIGTVSWGLDDNGVFGLDQVPEISRWVHDFYRHVADGYGQHFFLRTDLMPRAASVQLPKACAPTAVRCMASPRRFYGEGITTPVTDNQPPLNLPQHALVEVQFTPFGRQTANATILNNEAVPHSVHGLRFYNIGGDIYRLLLGLGNRWAESNPIPLGEGKPVWLSIEFAGAEVRIRANGALVDTMHLPAPMADAPGPITIGSWINGACRFSGTIDFFQVVDLGKGAG